MGVTPTRRVLTPEAIRDLPDVDARLAAVADFLDYVSARGKAGRELRRELITAARGEGWTRRRIADRLRVTETAVKQIMRGTIW
jgi:hypothetical protein